MHTRLLSILPLLALLNGCSDLCENEGHRSVRSPDGSLEAVLFQRSCGATTGFSTQIAVVAEGMLPSEEGNAFIADQGEAEHRAAWGGPWAEAVWLTPKHLLIKHDRKARLFKTEAQVEGVGITYQPVKWPPWLPEA